MVQSYIYYGYFKKVSSDSDIEIVEAENRSLTIWVRKVLEGNAKELLIHLQPTNPLIQNV